ncbi:MAG: hypothetical protein KC419_18875, partial [Anaerolineales bacterium]|nr:hypothetical protein [Anaerolineales bacterium]
MGNAKANHKCRTDIPHASPGQGLIEYVVLLSLASVAAIVGLTILGIDVRNTFKKIIFGSEPQIAEETLEITVVDNTQSGLGNLRIYAFAPDGSYLNKYQETNENGIATFKLEQGEYQFLVRYQQQGYWSEPISWPQQKQSTIQIDQLAFLVNVVDLMGRGVSDVPIYAYSSDSTYIGMEKQTNENGEAAFLLAPGEFSFRADYNGRENWSDTVKSADGSVTITVNTCPTGQFLAEYFNDRNFGGEPVLVQCEGNIDYTWQTGSPAPEVNQNLFTIRWSGLFDFSEGT